MSICKPRISILSVILLFALDTNAQNATTNHSPDLDSLLIEIKNVMKRERMPGLMLSIVRNDSILFSGGLGYGDLDKRISVTGSTLFHMHSVTKMFTALAIQKLIDEGRLRLDDKLRSIAPELKFQNDWEETHPVRVVHLLEHTAGFDDVHLNGMFNRSGKALAGIKAVESVSRSLVSRWRPGERMSYSNPGYVVLAYLIEKFSKKPWNDYITQHVLLPFGMRASNYDLTGEERSDYAKGYYVTGGNYKRFYLATPGGNGAGSALVSNADDMSRFIQNLLANRPSANGTWPSAETFAEFEKVHSTLAAANGLQAGYALGNQLFPNNKKITFRGHNGMGEGFNSWVLYNRAARMGYTICNNGNKGMWPVSKLIDDFLTKDLDAPKQEEVQGKIDRFIPLLGYYQFTNPRSELVGFHERLFNGITLSVANNKLVVKSRTGKVDTLINCGGNLFRASNDIIPSFVLGRDKEGDAFFHGYLDGFYKRKSYPVILIQKVFIFTGIAAMILAILIAVVSMVMMLIKRMKWQFAGVTLFPALAVVSLVAAVRKLRITDEIDKAAFATVNYASVYIYLGTLAFGLLSLATLYVLYSKWTKIPNRWARGVLTFNAIFIFYISCLLFYHGWIGLMTWSL